MKHLKKQNEQMSSQNKPMASQLRIEESSKSLELVSLTTIKEDCIIKGFKIELETYLSPSNAKR